MCSRPKIFQTLSVLVCTALLSHALPFCQLTGGSLQDLVCSPSSTDFTLEYGLVSDSPNVRSISLRGCRVAEIEMASFDNLPALESLDLSQNKLKAVRLGALDGFEQLKTLNLSKNQISGFELGLFDEKPNLEVLDVSHNQISLLQLGVLDGFRNLKVLNLSDNQLVSFPLGLFDQKPNLEYLILSRNRINKLELGVFDPMTKLKHVDISNNPLTGKDLSPWLFDQSPSVKYMDFSSINMAGTPDNLLHAFRALEFLILDNCSLNEVPGFVTKPNLGTIRHMVLSRNLIETIPTNAFLRTSIQFLDLSNNLFSYLPDQFSSQIRQSGTLLGNLNFEGNPWQCSCLLEVLNEVKLLNVVYNSSNYNGNTPVCVAEMGFNCSRDVGRNKYYTDMFNNLVKKI